jgi:hypothetical protein
VWDDPTASNDYDQLRCVAIGRLKSESGTPADPTCNVIDGEADQMGKRITTQAVSDLRRLVPDLLRV